MRAKKLGSPSHKSESSLRARTLNTGVAGIKAPLFLRSSLLAEFSLASQTKPVPLGQYKFVYIFFVLRGLLRVFCLVSALFFRLSSSKRRRRNLFFFSLLVFWFRGVVVLAGDDWSVGQNVKNSLATTRHTRKQLRAGIPIFKSRKPEN